MIRELHKSIHNWATRAISGVLLPSVIVSLAMLPGASTVARANSTPLDAPGGPGIGSHFDLARKDCVGTAYGRRSRVWFTVADGALSDVYYPTIDNTNVGSLQLVVTDGKTFTDLQSRDTTYAVRRIAGAAPGCTVTATAKSGKYRFTESFVSDPVNNTVMIHVVFTQLIHSANPLRIYVWFDPTINGNGGGAPENEGGDNAFTAWAGHRYLGVTYDRDTSSLAVNRRYAAPVYAALTASTRVTGIDNGFAGTESDGLTQLDSAHRLMAGYPNAQNGNVTQTLAIAGGRSTFNLALGFGRREGLAESAALRSIHRGYPTILRAYVKGWQSYDSGLRAPSRAPSAISKQEWRRLSAEYYLSANLLKTSEDKTYPGAIVASPTAPWGQAVAANTANNLYYGGYREVWARDLYEIFTGLMADGDRRTAVQTVKFLFYRQQQPDGSFPRNSLVNGKPAPDSNETQLDECSYPIIMAYDIGWRGSGVFRRIESDADYVISNGPAEGVERWEDQTGYSPSTIAAEIAGLTAASAIARQNHHYRDALIWQAVADQWQRDVMKWTVTHTGSLSKQPYFIRLSKYGNPNIEVDYDVGNGAGYHDQRTIVDQGFLELVRLGELSPLNHTVVDSLRVVDASIRRQLPEGPGWLRYTYDGYGDQSQTGTPWVYTYQGTGRPWPVLTGERAEYELAAGRNRNAASLLREMDRMAFGVGLMPEQVWNGRDLAPSPQVTDGGTASIGFTNGQADGSATPLNWAQAQFIRLFTDVEAGRVQDRPAFTEQRYVAGRTHPAWVSVNAPADQAVVTSGALTVRGTATPGSRVLVSAITISGSLKGVIFSGRAGAMGRYSIPVTVASGAAVLNIAIIGPHGGTADRERTVFFE